MPSHQFTYPKVTPIVRTGAGGPLCAAAAGVTTAAPRR